MPKLKEYLKGENGKPSSTRLFSSLFIWYFFVINIMIMLLVFLGKTELDVNTIIFTLTHDFLILLAIFAPKQLAKMEEIKGILSIAKNNPQPPESEEIG